MESSEYVIGTCQNMCPRQEAKLRERQRLLHVFEVVSGTEKDEFPKVDFSRVVKTYTRSAAGKCLTDQENLRPPSVLLETVEYLLHDIINRKADWIMKYNFIVDRLRSVRQDMIIQNLSREYQILILQPIIRFHAYAAYRFCEEKIEAFDSYINNKHLLECLKRLLCIYDYFDYVHSYIQKNVTVDFKIERVLESYRCYFETLYLIFNLDDVEAVTRILNLPRHWRKDMLVPAIEISLYYLKGNFIRVCKLLKKLPLTLQMIAYLHMPELRRLYFGIMSVAYDSKNLTFSQNDLMKLLLFNSDEEFVSYCNYYNLTIKNGGVCFSKEFKKNKIKQNLSRSKEIDEKLLHLDISALFLYGDP